MVLSAVFMSVLVLSSPFVHSVSTNHEINNEIIPEFLSDCCVYTWSSISRLEKILQYIY